MLEFLSELLLDCLHLFIDLQIQAACSALRNTRGLPWPALTKENEATLKKDNKDILDWLQLMFGFQVKTGLIYDHHLVPYISLKY
jgi:hypothetical protein